MKFYRLFLNYSLLIIGSSLLLSHKADTEDKYAINAAITLSRSSDGALVELKGLEGYTAETTRSSDEGDVLFLKITDHEGKQLPDTFTVGKVAFEKMQREGVAQVDQVSTHQTLMEPVIHREFIVDDSSAEKCSKFASFVSEGVPEEPLRQAMTFYYKNLSIIANPRYIAISDYSEHSGKRRFYLLNMTDATVNTEKVSHGSGSPESGATAYGDPENDGYLNRCSQPESSKNKYNQARENPHLNMTRAGFFQVKDFYQSDRNAGKWPWLDPNKEYNGMRLAGLSGAVNEEAETKGVVIHEAYYNSDLEGQIMGRSFGCPAFVPKHAYNNLIKLRGGGLYYSFAPPCKEEMRQVLQQVSGWENFCKSDIKFPGGSN